ncbi:MAG: Rieske (2Fe-2S) protein [Candidatus Nanoarchaeia archaeon]
MIKFNVGKVSEVPINGMKCFKVEENEILVINDEGKFYAIENLCTHRQTPLEQGFIQNGCITCPFHGAEFNLTLPNPEGSRLLRRASSA